MYSRLPFLIPFIAICEIFLIIQVGGMIGFWATVGIVILTGMTGVWLLRRQGFSLIAQVQEKMNRGEIPATELMEGVALMMGGVMLITPGFMTDVMGLSLILPFTRKGLVRFLQLRLLKSPNVHTQTFYQQGGFYSGTQQGPQQGPRMGESQAGGSPFNQGPADTGSRVIEGEFTRENGQQEENSEKK
ncbi:FxsA family protein [Hahella ganghwensis]|uniref:FxsA family protein n=1 Tax=Hahella ganghwensis TaxID=286420 RepID=UPI00037E44DC|nr:FxsA family protein [Hahella ganghwensis]